jgi:hypothetical protein
MGKFNRIAAGLIVTLFIVAQLPSASLAAASNFNSALRIAARLK